MSQATVSQSVLDAAGPQAGAIESLWWLIFGIAVAVFAAVMVLLVVAVRRKSVRQSSDVVMARWVTAAAGITVIVLFVWLVASVSVGRATASPHMADAITINITGRQWWWQLEYSDSLPSNMFKSANELLIPAGRAVVVNVTSRDVNDYLREAAGGADYSARDFRTWSGTVLAMVELQQRRCSAAGEIKRNLIDGIRSVASKLGNTPAVCRRCYVHPWVIDRYIDGKLPRGNSRLAHARARATSLSGVEKATLAFLQCCRREEKSGEFRRRRDKRIPKAWRA